MSSRRRNLWFVLLGLLAAGIAAAGIFLISQTQLLAIDSVVVEGNRAISNEEVLDRAAPLLRGQSILKPSFDDATRTLTALPYTESVEVDRDFPRTVIIRVREYRPFVSLAAAEGKFVVLSQEGRVLVAEPAPTPELPLITTKEPCPAEVGSAVACQDVFLGIEFLAGVPTSFNQEIAEVRVVDGDVTVRTLSGVNIHFGTLDDYDLKFEVLRQLMARSAAAGQMLMIDVSVVERPVTREGNASTTATTATTETTQQPEEITQPVEETAGQVEETTEQAGNG